MNMFLVGLEKSIVTLHVSVWVEILVICTSCKTAIRHAPRERVSWNCQQKSSYRLYQVTLHVSVWVEIFIFTLIKWTCCHAPRERVSWNTPYFGTTPTSTRSRSTWACELKWQKLRKPLQRKRSRSTWACELKLSLEYNPIENYSSRSTWACELKYKRNALHLTSWMSRSTWACELKFGL